MKRAVLLSIFSLFFLTACHNFGGGVRIGGHYSHGHNGPPAHGRGGHHRYHYYPNAEFYFDIGRNMYFYLDSSAQWAFSATLPIRLRHHLHNNYVEIEMKDDRPYRRHKHYRNKYKKHKTRYKLKHKSKHKYKSREQKHNTNHEYKNSDRKHKTKHKQKHKVKSKYKKNNKKDKKHRNDKPRW